MTTSVKLTVSQFIEDNAERLKLENLTPEVVLNRHITTSKLNNPGLELAGFWQHFMPEQVQIMGIKEMNFLGSIADKTLEIIFKKLFSFKIPVLLFVGVDLVPEKIISLAKQFSTPLFIAKMDSTQFLNEASRYLYSKFAPRSMVHGTLIDIYGVGILFTGRSGIGKSEIALDLVERGHRLVADDVVNIEMASDNILMGYGEQLLQDTIEIRGVGIIDIRKTFGIRAVRTRKRVEVMIELVDWNLEDDYERFGLVDIFTPILGIDIPFVKLPIFPGKNITVITEVIALNHLLKLIGEHPAKEFQHRLELQIKKNQATMDDDRFAGDYE